MISVLTFSDFRSIVSFSQHISFECFYFICIFTNITPNVEIIVYFNGNELAYINEAAAIFCISRTKNRKLMSNK